MYILENVSFITLAYAPNMHTTYVYYKVNCNRKKQPNKKPD